MEGLNTTYRLPTFMAPPALKSPSQGPVITPAVISPWEVFDKAWTMIMGYPASDFEYVVGETPLSTFKETAIFLTLYLVGVFGGRELMRNRPAFKLNALFQLHNLYLTYISGGLLVLFIEQLVPNLWKYGLYKNICGKEGWTQPMVVLYYLNYLTKYLELLDTVFLVLKKKPLSKSTRIRRSHYSLTVCPAFLHTYHHPATAFLCYTQLMGHTSISWVPITLNLTVHVVMYWYYFQSARGVKIWWKKYITVMQITQFVIDLGFIYFATWDYWAGNYAPWLPHYKSCPGGEEFASIVGTLILSSYLVLFIAFYISTYKKSPRNAVAKVAVERASKAEVPTALETAEKATEVVKVVHHAVADNVF